MIRPARIEDIGNLLELGRAMLEESAYRGMPYEEEKIGALLEKVLSGAGCVFVAEDDRLCGFVVGLLSELWFCHVKIATDLGLFVLPEKRGSLAGPRLLSCFIDWARSQGVAEIYLGISTGVNLEGTERLYAGFGFSKVGGLYKLRI